MTLVIRSTVEVQTNSIALPPSGEFIAYVDRGVIVDDMSGRWLRGKHKVVSNPAALVRGASNAGVVVTDCRELSFARVEGRVQTLRACDRHVPLCVHGDGALLTAVFGTHVVTWSLPSCEVVSSVDVADDLEVEAFYGVSVDGPHTVLWNSGRFVHLIDGELETVFPIDRRFYAAAGAGFLVSCRPSETEVLSLETHEPVTGWEGEGRNFWASGKFVSVGHDLTVRDPSKWDATIMSVAPRKLVMSPMDMVCVADAVNLLALAPAHGDVIRIYAW